MTRIAFLLLAHKDPAGVAAQARMLSAGGDGVIIHFDGRAPRAAWLALVEAVAGLPRVHLVTRRVRCGWGQWSLVAASLRLLQAGLQHCPWATHVYLLSGDCWPIRPAAGLRAALSDSPQDHIECAGFFGSDWIKTGLRDERVLYRHPFNERSQRTLFYTSLALQKRAGLTRRLPGGLSLRVGSQWWCLRRGTAQAILDFCRRRPDVPGFFRLSWIPDETFFQTLTAHLVPEAEITGAPPTRVHFSDYGLPVVFHDDHADLLLGQERGFFVRKVAPEAHTLRTTLAGRFAAPADAPAPAPHPCLAQLHAWQRARGRSGRRAPPPPWNRPAPRIDVIICKRWHLAAGLAAQVGSADGRHVLGHVFDEMHDGDPPLGGFGRMLEARRADPLGYLSRAAEVLDADRIIVGLDPCRLEVLDRLRPAAPRVVWLDKPLDPAFVEAHSHRIGLGPGYHDEVAAELATEARALAQAAPANMAAIGATSGDAAAGRLARALDIKEGLAKELVDTLGLTKG